MKYLTMIFAAVFCVSCMSMSGLDDMVGQTCPQTGFLSGGDRSAFTHDGIDFEVAMTELIGSCRYPSSEKVILKTAFTIVTKADNPAAAAGQKITIPYVAAILDENENIYARQDNQAMIEIDSNGTGSSFEEFEQTIPVNDPVQASRMKVFYSFTK